MPNELSVTLALTDDTRAELSATEGALSIAEAYHIDSPELAIAANEDLRLIKQRKDRIEELRRAFIAPAQQIIDTANGFFVPARDLLAQTEIMLKQKIANYTNEETRKLNEARQRAEEAKRVARQKAEQEAAAERAKAEAEAKRQRELAAEQERARAALEAEGKTRAAKQAAAEVAKSLRRAEQAAENGESKARQLELEAAARPEDPIPEPTHLEGFSMRDNWVAEAWPDQTDEAALAKVAAATVERAELLALLKIDWPAANKLAKALKAKFNVPGMRAINRQIAAQRS